MTVYQSRARRRRRWPTLSTMVFTFGMVVMTACLLIGADLKLRGHDAFLAPTRAPAPEWVAPSHPVGTGESLYLHNGTGR